LANLRAAGTAGYVFDSHPKGAAMFYAICIVLLPFLAYSLYEDWRDAVENRSRQAEKK
jgi:di/tricarboxylate transporter